MKLTPLFEVTFSETPQVDREAGIIRGVRILGRSSRNGREYSDAALDQAARLYEGLGVNLNHREQLVSGTGRAIEEGFGWLEAIAVRADGVFGDLHYFRAHPQADVIVEAAERNPRRFGLSHHAEGHVAQRDGKSVVESIESVKSVDLVQNPATNQGLFESQDAEEDEGPIDHPGEAQLHSLLVGLLENEQLPLTARFEQMERALRAHRAPGADSSSPGGSTSLEVLLERISRIESQAHCRTLLDAAHRTCSLDRLDALQALPGDEERQRLIETWPATEPGRAFATRPASSRPLFESDGMSFPGNVKSFVAALR